MEERKHLFGTSEKSDFILNMTKEGAQKLLGVYSIVAMCLLAVCALPYYLTKDVIRSTEDLGVITVNHYYTENTVLIMSTVLIVVGFFSILMYIIASMKHEVTLKNKKLFVSLLLLVTVLSLVSLIQAFSPKLAFFGDSYRNDGYLEYLANCGFIAVGLFVAGDKWRKRFADTLVIIGAAEALFGIVQCFSTKVPNYFGGLFLGFPTGAPGEIVSDQGYLMNDKICATGLMCSPYALAAVLCVCFAFSAAGAMYDSNKKKKILYILACGVMTAASILTHVFTGYVGIPCVIAVLLTIEIVRLATKHALYSGKPLDNPVISCIIILCVTAALFVGFKIGGGLVTYDEAAFYTDNYYRLSTSYPNRVDTGREFYEELRHQGAVKVREEIVDNGMFFGIGQDNGSYILSENMRADRFYNDYLDFMVQRGIVPFIAYCLFLLYVLWCGVKAVWAFIKKEQPSYYAAAAFSGLIGFLVLMFWNTSSNTSTYYMFLCIGIIMLCAEKKELSHKERKKQQQAKSKKAEKSK